MLPMQLFSLSQQIHGRNLHLNLRHAWLLTAKQIPPQTCWCIGKCTVLFVLLLFLSVSSVCENSYIPSRKVFCMNCNPLLYRILSAGRSIADWKSQATKAQPHKHSNLWLLATNYNIQHHLYRLIFRENVCFICRLTAPLCWTSSTSQWFCTVGLCGWQRGACFVSEHKSCLRKHAIYQFGSDVCRRLCAQWVWHNTGTNVHEEVGVYLGMQRT